MPLHPDPDTAVAQVLADIRDEARRREAAEAAKASQWSFSKIAGVAVSLLTIFGMVAVVLQGYTQLGDRLQSFGERMLSLDARVVVIESTFRDRGRQRDQELASLTAANSLQDERLQNITKALEQERQSRIDSEADVRRADADLRAVVSDLAKSMSEMRTDLKVLVDRAERKTSIEGSPEKDAEARLPR